MNIKQKLKKNTANEYRCFPESNFVGVIRLFVLIYLNRDSDVKIFKARRYYLPKDIIKIYDVIINRRDSVTKPLILIQNNLKNKEN